MHLRTDDLPFKVVDEELTRKRPPVQRTPIEIGQAKADDPFAKMVLELALKYNQSLNPEQ
jgi:hypothetical protein